MAKKQIESFDDLMSERDRLELRQAEIARVLADQDNPPDVADLGKLMQEQTAIGQVLKALEPRIARAHERDKQAHAEEMKRRALALRPAERTAFLAVVDKARELHAAIEALGEVYIRLAHCGEGPLTTVPGDLVKWTTPGVGNGLDAWARTIDRMQL